MILIGFVFLAGVGCVLVGYYFRKIYLRNGEKQAKQYDS